MPIPRKPITLKTPLEARKAFKINGRHISPGTPFNWQRLAVPWHRVRILYEGGFVVVRKDSSKPSLVFSDVEQAYLDELGEEKLKEFHSLCVEDQRAALEELMNAKATEATGEPDTIEILHRGRGWYDVLKNGKPVNETGLREKEAETLAQEMREPTEDLFS